MSQKHQKEVQSLQATLTERQSASLTEIKDQYVNQLAQMKLELADNAERADRE